MRQPLRSRSRISAGTEYHEGRTKTADVSFQRVAGSSELSPVWWHEEGAGLCAAPSPRTISRPRRSPRYRLTDASSCASLIPRPPAGEILDLLGFSLSIKPAARRPLFPPAGRGSESVHRRPADVDIELVNSG